MFRDQRGDLNAQRFQGFRGSEGAGTGVQGLEGDLNVERFQGSRGSESAWIRG